MKKYILTLVVVTFGIISIAGNNNKEENSNTRLLSGKVVDKTSGEEIAGAEIKLGDKTIYSDLNGNFTTSININSPELIVKYVSYQDTKITINSFSYQPILIELASK